MTYAGYEELKNYLNGNRKPSFIKFVNDNIDMLPMWSSEENVNTGPALFGICHNTIISFGIQSLIKAEEEND